MVDQMAQSSVVKMDCAKGVVKDVVRDFLWATETEDYWVGA